MTVLKASPQIEPQLRLGAGLTGVALFVTLAVASYPLAGVWVSLGVGILGLVATFVGSRVRASVPAGHWLGPYVLTVVLTLLADTARYQVRYFEPLGAAVDWRLPPLDGRIWFLFFVVAPVSLMLFGGYLVGRARPGAGIAAWWTAMTAGVDGVLYLTVSATAGWSQPLLGAAAVAATVCQLLAVAVLGQRLLQPLATGAAPAPARPMSKRSQDLWTVLIVALVAVYGISLLQQAGPLPVGVIVGSMIGGLIGWRRTTAHRPADPSFHVPMFLLLLTFFYLHVGEEALTYFNQAVSAISGTPWEEGPFTTLIGLLGPTVWVFAAWSLWHRQPFGNFVLWFLAVGMILGEPIHILVFPVMRMAQDGVDYGYFSGMYTALFPMIPAILCLQAILRDHLHAREVKEG